MKILFRLYKVQFLWLFPKSIPDVKTIDKLVKTLQEMMLKPALCRTLENSASGLELSWYTGINLSTSYTAKYFYLHFFFFTFFFSSII